MEKGIINDKSTAMNIAGILNIVKRSGHHVQFDANKIRSVLERVARNHRQYISVDLISAEVAKNIYHGATTEEIEKALIFSTVSFIEKDPAYGYVAAQLLLQKVFKEVFGHSVTDSQIELLYRESFVKSIQRGVAHDVFHKDLLSFDLERLAGALNLERDMLLDYLGMQTLADRYFLKLNKKRAELPQTFWMRIAMGLSINEPNKNERAIEFYEVLSTLRYTPSTPTLFHAGYKVAQLSSCYLSTIQDDLSKIFKCMGDNAQLSKWAGGIGNDWTPIRGTGALIKGIHATSQGVIPFMKFANDIVVAITRSGIRRGGTCAYLEVWHLDIEDFLDLRRNTGDERRRAHDMNTANWIPDLFMKRVLQDKEWTLFSPDETADLHELYGKKFEARYLEYEQMSRDGKIQLFRTVSAQKLWRKMLSRLFETGHPWITFKDPCNIRSPQDHAGVVHSSNLCTEITLNTSQDETAVCNLGSINLAMHIKDGHVDYVSLAESVKVAIRMLDNVIDLNFYPTIEAKNSNERHRPVGLGQMGFQDALFLLDIPFGSEKAVVFADTIAEFISYEAISASNELARERGSYPSYRGSKWDRGIFPLDTVDLLEQERGMRVECSRTSRLDWVTLKERVKKNGMRNSNLMAVAPTATISNIVGCYPCIEPIYANLYVKSNIAGEFTIVNTYLVEDLKKVGLWNEQMLAQLKFHNGEVGNIQGIPQSIKEKYKTAFEHDPLHGLRITAERGKWIDQSQSHNVFMKGASGKKLSEIYEAAWRFGLKTTYYLRTLGATGIEKSTLGAEFGFTQKRDNVAMAVTETVAVQIQAEPVKGAACDPFDTSCESCQ